MDVLDLAWNGKQNKIPQLLSLKWAARPGCKDPVAQAIAYADSLRARQYNDTMSRLLLVFALLLFLEPPILGVVAVRSAGLEAFRGNGLTLILSVLVAMFLGSFPFGFGMAARGRPSLPPLKDAEQFVADLTSIEEWAGHSVSGWRSASYRAVREEITGLLVAHAKVVERCKNQFKQAKDEDGRATWRREENEAYAKFVTMQNVFNRHDLASLDPDDYFGPARKELYAQAGVESSTS